MRLIKILGLSLYCMASAYAVEGKFITIIGPDGHPMNVSYPEQSADAVPSNTASQVPPKATAKVKSAATEQQPVVTPNQDDVQTPRTVPMVSDKPTTTVVPQSMITVPKTSAENVEAKPIKPSPIPSRKIETQKNVPQSALTPKVQTASQLTAATQEKSALLPTSPLPAQVAQTKRTEAQPTLSKAQPKALVATATESATTTQPFEVVDGQKYYDAEFLESKEFNIDHKKRFYQLQDGSGTWQTVEREKGADMTWFRGSQIVPTQKKTTAVLGSQYRVLSSADLRQVLPTSCIDLHRNSKAKKLSVDQPVLLWPRPALKSQFDYSVIALQGNVQDFALMSYSKTINSPEYYWPLVVFLDEKGCVLEGVSAYFSKAYAATALQNPAIEGIIHVPAHSQYVLLSPLEHAMDVPELKLSNQGQIKLTALR